VWRGSQASTGALLRSGRPAGAARVLALRARGPFVVPQLREDGNGGLTVSVRIADDAPAGRFRDEIVVRGSGLDAPIVIPVLGVVRAGDDDRDVVARAAESIRR